MRPCQMPPTFSTRTFTEIRYRHSGNIAEISTEHRVRASIEPEKSVAARLQAPRTVPDSSRGILQELHMSELRRALLVCCCFTVVACSNWNRATPVSLDDSATEAEIRAKLTADGLTAVEIEIKDGVVVIRGSFSADELERAHRDAAKVPGVRAVIIHNIGESAASSSSSASHYEYFFPPWTPSLPWPMPQPSDIEEIPVRESSFATMG